MKLVQFPGTSLACPWSDCTYLCCLARCIRRRRFRRITRHSFTNVISSRPIMASPLHILIDTSSNGNPDNIFVLKARNRAWLHFYSAIQILCASPSSSPPFLVVPLAMVCIYYLYQTPNRRGKLGGEHRRWIWTGKNNCRINLYRST
jgi:hypothetical protein